MRDLKKRHKLLLTATAITTAAGAVGMGSWASWSTSETTREDIASGSFAMRLDGQLVERAVVPVTNFAPGDSVTRTLDVTNTGSIDFSSVQMRLFAEQEGPLLDDSGKGLDISVLQCAVPWTEDAPVGEQIEDVHGFSCRTDSYRPAGDYDHELVDGHWNMVYVGEHQGYYLPHPLYDGEFQFVGSERVSEALPPQVVRHGSFTTSPVALPDGALRSGGQQYTLNSVEPSHEASTAHLLVTVSMPDTTGAGQDVQDPESDYARYGDQRVVISYGFTGIQRTGTEVQHLYDGNYGVDDANVQTSRPQYS